MFFNRNTRSIKRTNKLLQHINLPNEGSVLDLSCGDGKLLKSIHGLKPHLKLFGIDMSDQNLGTYINFQKSQAEAIPFPSKSFDVVICSMSLHHYEHPEKVLIEINRVINTPGVVYILDIMPKNKLSQKIYNLIGCNEPYHFEKFYTVENLKKISKNHNFIWNRITPLGIIPRLYLIELKQSQI